MKKLTFMEALANEDHRRTIDAIEDMLISLRGRDKGDMLWDVFRHACEEFEKETGIDLYVD